YLNFMSAVLVVSITSLSLLYLSYNEFSERTSFGYPALIEPTASVGLLVDINAFLFPFVYIFIIVTLLTLLFCFAYNRAELRTFALFVSVIFAAGWGLFTTNSFFMFFMFYETLLIPSFVILYNNAKTRKAVEAAYLMFF